MDLIDKVIAWSSKKDPELTHLWLTFARMYMEGWGFNSEAIAAFLAWGEYGFNIPWLPTEEVTVPDFYGEVHYCSDRMSMDRLFRCHVMFRMLQNQA